MLITTLWPTEFNYDDIAAAEFNQLKDLVTEIRFVTAELPGNKKYRLLYDSDALVADNAVLIAKLAKLQEVVFVDSPKGLRLPNSGREVWLDVSEETLYEHRTNLETRLAEAHALIANLEARLANNAYLDKAPKKLVEDTKAQLESKKALVATLLVELDVIS